MDASAKPEYMADAPRVETTDVMIVGAGHNGLVAAILLARQGTLSRICIHSAEHCVCRFEGHCL